MKKKSINYLMPLTPVFNNGSVPIFESMDSEHSGILWTALYLNAYEVLSTYNGSDLILILDETDKQFVPDKLKNSIEILFYKSDERDLFFKSVNEKYVNQYENNILFFSNSIGYTHQDISRALNLLNMNDDTVILARSDNNKICFTGFNSYLDFLEKNIIDYNTVLTESCRYNSFIHTLDNFISVNDTKDFKRLYTELSKKESLSYCSQEMHELFTHIFIEYKDLLK
jgi:hypothetical protein